MSPHRMSRSLISWWKVNITSTAKNAMIASTNADENNRTRSGTSLFIGALVVIGLDRLICFSRAGSSHRGWLQLMRCTIGRRRR